MVLDQWLGESKKKFTVTTIWRKRKTRNDHVYEFLQNKINLLVFLNSSVWYKLVFCRHKSKYIRSRNLLICQIIVHSAFFRLITTSKTWKVQALETMRKVDGSHLFLFRVGTVGYFEQSKVGKMQLKTKKLPSFTVRGNQDTVYYFNHIMYSHFAYSALR